MSRPLLRSVEISAAKLREMFAEAKIEERAAAGELSIVFRKSNPARKELGMPAGTLGQFIDYVDAQGNTVASAHRYLKPDGTLAASGKLDPKALVQNGVRYTLWWGGPPTFNR